MDNQSVSAFLSVSGALLDGYIDALATLDDETVNQTPAAGTVNTPFALVTHIHGMTRFWGGSVISGVDYPRDREAEFHASGSVEHAVRLLAEVRSELPMWAEHAATGNVANPSAKGTSRSDVAEVGTSWILAHITRELAQHLGHLEVCRDLVLADAVKEYGNQHKP